MVRKKNPHPLKFKEYDIDQPESQERSQPLQSESVEELQNADNQTESQERSQPLQSESVEELQNADNQIESREPSQPLQNSPAEQMGDAPDQNPLLIDGEVVNLSDLYEIDDSEENYSTRFRTVQVETEVYIDERVGRSPNPEALFDMILADIIESTRDDSFKNPHVSLTITQEDTTNVFHLRFMELEKASPSMIRREMEMSSQSTNMPSPLVQTKLSLNIVHVDVPSGSGKRSFSNTDNDINITPIHGKDYCLPAAVAVGIAYVNREGNGDEFRSISRSPKKQVTEAIRLQHRAGITKNRNYEIEEVKLLQRLLFKDNIQLIVFDGTKIREPLFIGPYFAADRIVGLRLSDGHFDHIKKVSSFFGRKHYCAFCDVLYDSERSHYNCRKKCQRCGEKDSKDCVGEEEIICDTCDGLFFTRSCFDNHNREGVRGGAPYCKAVSRCEECGQKFDEKRHQRKHICGHQYCKQCQTDAPIGHKTCFISPVPPLSDAFVKKTIVFDIETTVKEVLGMQKRKKMKRRRHIPNLIIALRSCEHCETRLPSSPSDFELECDQCGGQKLHKWSAIDDPGKDIMKEFVDWVFSSQHKKFTVIAHNLRGFDGQFVLRQVAKIAPLKKEDISLVGRKLMYLKGNDVRWVDSLNFLTMPLASFSPTFDIKELKKGFFPHTFNIPSNYGYVGKTPPIADYLSKNMKPKLKEEIVKWHSTVQNEEFNFRREIDAYCLSDVLLLHEGVRRFDEDCFKDTGVRIFHESRTCASAAMKVFRRNFLTANTLAIEKTEAVEEAQSRMALKYLSWLRHSTGENIQDARNGGEFQVPGTKYKVDGFVKVEGGRSKVYEIYGDYFHACECRYKDHHIILGRSAYEIRCRDRKRLEIIGKQYDVIVIRECDIRRELKENEKMREYYDQHELQDPLQVGEGFSGGRTEVYKIFHECSDDEEIVYLDFCSLYPTVNKYEPYPVGLGETMAGDRFKVPISRPEELVVDGVKVEGFVKCKIAPPRKLHLPVLMMRAGGKNCYAVCRTCALAQNPHGQGCNHSEEEREMAGVWTSFELRLALEEGYVITQVYQARHYSQWRQYKHSTDGVVEHGILSEYMNFFVKKKTEASGWPRPDMTDLEKKKYIDEYAKKEGIRLDVKKIVKKLAGRAVAKLMANSLWGKLGERNNRRKIKIFHAPGEYFSFLKDGDNEVLDVIVLTEFKVLVVYKKAAEALESIGTTSKASAALTTAFARIRLYRAMKKIRPEDLLYCDTDSIIFVKKKTAKNPLEDLMGDFLGDLTSEIPAGARCTQFVALAPKTYAYRLQFEDGRVKEVVKCKGFPLTCEAAEKIKYESMVRMAKKMVVGDEVEPLSIDYEMFSITKEHHVENNEITKRLGCAFTKRCFVPQSFNTLPYGY